MAQYGQDSDEEMLSARAGGTPLKAYGVEFHAEFLWMRSSLPPMEADKPPLTPAKRGGSLNQEPGTRESQHKKQKPGTKSNAANAGKPGGGEQDDK